MLAVCDDDVLGKSFSEGNFSLEVSECFYNGWHVSEDQIIPLLEEIPNVNIVGKKSVALAMRLGFVSKESIIIIQGVPHAQVFSIV